MPRSGGLLAFAICLSNAEIVSAQPQPDPPSSAQDVHRGDDDPRPEARPGRPGPAGTPAAGPVARSRGRRAAPSARPPAASGEVDGADSNLTESLGVQPEIFTARLYGFIDAHFEQVAKTPIGVDQDGETIFSANAAEMDVANLNVMVQGNIYSRYRYFLNLAAPDSGSPAEDVVLAVRNAWVELPLFRQYVDLRLGKTYRRFGLYNEILDAVPTFIGIEPPEMFDDDHLLLTRTTNVMLHGTLVGLDSSLSYALSTGTDERAGRQVPIGVDLRYDFRNNFRLGTSFYTSNGDAAPSKELGEGAPVGGVASWMEVDEFWVAGGYGQFAAAGFLLQAELWLARHRAARDPVRVRALEDSDPPLNARQRARFGLTDPMNPQPVTDADYDVKTGYLRAGYTSQIGSWSLVPYAQLDYYENPEIIDDQDNGGDNEAGGVMHGGADRGHTSLPLLDALDPTGRSPRVAGQNAARGAPVHREQGAHGHDRAQTVR